MSYIQRSIFEEEESPVEKEPEKKPIPLVKKEMVPKPELNLNTIYKEEALRLLAISPLRTFRSHLTEMEIQNISDCLTKAVERSGRKAESIIGFAEEILKNWENFYPTQAIDCVADGEAFRMLKNINSKPKIIRR